MKRYIMYLKAKDKSRLFYILQFNKNEIYSFYTQKKNKILNISAKYDSC